MGAQPRRYAYEPDYAVPPGETLAETLESLDLSQKQLAARTGLTVQTINRIIAGTQPLTYDTADKLELATGVPARLWNNLESQYREQKTRLERQAKLEADIDWLKQVPVRELIKRGVLPDEKDKPTQLRNVLAVFGVSDVDAYETTWSQMPVAARKSQKVAECKVSLSAWICLGERTARETPTKPYNEAQFREAIQRVRGLTTADPKTFVPEMIRLCADAGVAVCLVPEFPKVPWYAASRWLSARKAMILLGLRGKREDHFWFSFFHEAAHLLFDSKKEMFLNEGKSDHPCEVRANKFAAETLVPPTYSGRVKAIRSGAQARSLAAELGIAPGIVVGQWQRATNKWDQLNSLRRQLKWEG